MNTENNTTHKLIIILIVLLIVVGGSLWYWGMKVLNAENPQSPEYVPPQITEPAPVVTEPVKTNTDTTTAEEDLSVDVLNGTEFNLGSGITQ